ncbi:hypothetical protein RUM44_009111 [Polyplax serrata]|uniref:Uncharacterized protein n=1 Tax=Polyplax serrata TaxID=468196 RepID=A0ABR1ARS1_POLSC
MAGKGKVLTRQGSRKKQTDFLPSPRGQLSDTKSVENEQRISSGKTHRSEAPHVPMRTCQTKKKRKFPAAQRSNGATPASNPIWSLEIFVKPLIHIKSGDLVVQLMKNMSPPPKHLLLTQRQPTNMKPNVKGRLLRCF